ncbi:hypothetical protein O181_005295 [Austropuccinia psidii MF-1]|uniref:Phospholipid-transporting ATPase n=1 Tax=Austropuccinia psidii MF-1 TaxID=1389203 RepID=A0A9Q3GFP8_9BASI|nr:hypothetical protein [Austropuccinia psidii MF-1]
MSSPPSQQPLKQVKTTTISSSTHPKSLTHQIPISKQNKRKFKFLQSSIDKLTAIDLSTWFDSSLNWKNVKPPKIYVNLNLPISASNSNKNKKLIKDWYHPNNQIKTAKYSVLSFIPRNLLEQFRRVANVFFLVLVILQFIPKFIQVSPALAALPLLCVLAITAIKDAHEDARRHASDHQSNLQTVLTLSQSVYTNQNSTHPKTSSAFSAHFLFRLLRFNRQKIKSSNSTAKPHWFSFPCNSKLKQTPKLNSTNSNLHSNQQQHCHHDHDDLNNGFQIKTWQDLQVGDFVKLKNNQAVPADIIICSTSDEEENVCFIETKNLDGETNLKSRHALQSLSHLRNSSNFSSSNHHPQDHPNQFTVENQLPDPNMFSYNAVISFPDRHNHSSSPNQSQSIKSQHQVPVNLISILLRGTVIRNTEWIIGLVIFTGPNTKIMLNSSPTPSKRSKVERQMNPMVFINLAILALMCLFNAIGTHLAEKYYYKRNAYWSVGSDRSDDNPDINGLIGFAYAMITYQNIVPISLYISIEFVRTIQAYFIWADKDLKYKGRCTLARSWNLSDDLGQIQYIFTDKTGTLTQNLMQFKQCSIAGKIYCGHHQPDEISKEEDVMTDDTTMNRNIEPIKESSKLSTLHPNPAHRTSPRKLNQDSLTDSNAEKSKQDSQDSHNVLDSSKLLIEPFKDIELSKDLAMLNTDCSRMIHGFFACLALCHTILVSEESDGSIHYKAQSPDEAAADTGFVFRGRDKNIIKLQVPSVFNKLKPPLVARSTQQLEIEPVDDVISEEEHSSEIHEYELLELIEFTSVRKRMSVIVKKIAKDELNSDPQIYLLVKGADNVIFERLAPVGNCHCNSMILSSHWKRYEFDHCQKLVDQLENLPPNCSQSDPYTLQPSTNQSPRQIRNLSLHEDLESILGEDNGNRAADLLSANKGVGLSLATKPPVIQSFEDLRISKAQELPTRTAQNRAIDNFRLHPPPPVSQHEPAALLHHHQSTQTRFRQAVTASPSGPLRLKANGRIQKPEVKNGGLVPIKQSPAATKNSLAGKEIASEDFVFKMRQWWDQLEAEKGTRLSKKKFREILFGKFFAYRKRLEQQFLAALSVLEHDFEIPHNSQPSTVAHTLVGLGN